MSSLRPRGPAVPTTPPHAYDATVPDTRGGAGATESLRRLRICIVGALLGRHAGLVITQGEILRDHFAEHGYRIHAFSGLRNRYVRLAHIVASLVWHRRRTDVLLLQTYSGRSFVVEDIASALGRLFGHRVVMHLHGGGMPAFMAQYPRWSRRVLSRADAIVAPSNFLAEAVDALDFRARVIPNVIDVEDYPFRLRERLRPRLLWMRAFHPLYNPMLALRVLQRVREEHPDATLVMGGQDGGHEHRVRVEAGQMGLAGAVRFAGYLDRDRKRREWEAADIYLNTNHVDNTPVTVIEAGAMGVPVVATNVGGVRHMLRDGHTGLLVADDDADAMAGAVLRLLAEPPLARTLSTNGRALAERSAWPRVLDEWERLFAELSAQRERGTRPHAIRRTA